MPESAAPSQMPERHFELVRELGLSALRFLFTLNSGGFVVLLTFLGSFSETSRFRLPLWALQWAMTLMLCGVVLAFLIMVVSYFNAARNSQGRRLRIISPAIVWINTAGAVSSIFCFALAVLILVRSFEIAQ